MLLYFIVFSKRPKYALAFLPLIFMYILTYLKGNSFIGLALLFFSVISWCHFSLALYISDKKVNSTIFGIDLKTYVPATFWIIGIYALILGYFWILAILRPISIFSTNFVMTILFGYAFLALVIGKSLLFASMAIKLSKSDLRANKPSAQRLFEELKNLISQQ